MNIKAYRIQVAYGKNNGSLMSIQPFKKDGKEIIFLDREAAINTANTEFQAVSGLKIDDFSVTQKYLEADGIYFINNDPDKFEDHENHQEDDWWQFKVIECEVWASGKTEEG